MIEIPKEDFERDTVADVLAALRAVFDAVSTIYRQDPSQCETTVRAMFLVLRDLPGIWQDSPELLNRTLDVVSDLLADYIEKANDSLLPAHCRVCAAPLKKLQVPNWENSLLVTSYGWTLTGERQICSKCRQTLEVALRPLKRGFAL